MPSDLAGVANAIAALACVTIAVVTWRRRSLNLTFAVSLTFVLAGGGWWSLALAVVESAGQERVVAVATLATFPGPSVLVTAFMCLGFSLARPHWVPRRWVLAALLVEPALITAAAATNPWHRLVYDGPGADRLTGAAGWTYGPLFWIDSAYGFLAGLVGITLIALGWWSAAPAFRRQRFTLLLAALVPLTVNAAFLAGWFGAAPDPTPLGFAVTGTIIWFAIFRQDLFTFSPVARALIVDQINDVVVVVSPGGRVLDLNPSAVALARRIASHATGELIGSPARAVFGDDLAGTLGRATDTEVPIETVDGRLDFHVQGSPLVDRRRRALGTVYVARDVTEANALVRSLASAHAQLVLQVETIDVLRADLVELANRDALTGLHNRRFLVARCAEMLAAAERTGGSLAVVLVDVDRFKSVNDDHGHLAGDAVLIALARRMQEHVPPGALVARWGGEEFFVALPGADVGEGEAFAEALRRRCEEEPVTVAEHEIRCTISGGVAAYPASGLTVDELFHAADVSMYEAKNAGRNRVRVAAPAPTRG